jgi:CheY-like chemotaxis protein
MQEARILHIEDDLSFRECVAELLAVRGVHKIVAIAESTDEALQRIDEIKRGVLDANAILMDGHINGPSVFNHPKMIRSEMKKRGVLLPVVGLSLEGLSERNMRIGMEINADIRKEELAEDLDLLDAVLDSLPEPGSR